ncbi:Hypothetical predicted protein [Octopus vulgaris]|uniref:Uncharacterized protein n=1 Tax=Octopus vulgaris TaxID=6645 RepID=A0AA36BQK9_OCTVU|nr:Hypothetical predicted protein [Octopus vulgaris]
MFDVNIRLRMQKLPTESLHNENRFIWVQICGVSDKTPHLIAQPEFNDLVRDLTLTKQQSEVLVLRLEQWNLLDKDARITIFRKRSADLQQFFALENNLTYCNDIRDLFNALELTYEPNEWRLFIDAFLYSTKIVLLLIGNTMPSVPIVHPY